MPAKHSDKVERVSIVIDREVADVYRQMAERGGLSFAKCCGEWLADTVESAMFVSQKMAEARAAPQMVLNEMLALNAGMQDVLIQAKGEVRMAGKAKPAAPPPPPNFGLTPPYSNTGVKGYPKGRKS